jgi:SAM-dependent methyltransferase
LAIPAADEQVALVVCGLTLSHVSELHAAVAELSRVLRPGGHFAVSVLHPFLSLLGWHARFTTGDRRRGFVREYPHTHADYFSAFTDAGLQVQECLEPSLTAEHVSAQRRAFDHVPDAVTAAYEGLPAVLVLVAAKP